MVLGGFRSFHVLVLKSSSVIVSQPSNCDQRLQRLEFVSFNG